MTFQEAKDAIRRAKPLLRTISDLTEGLEKAAEMEKDMKALEVKNVEALKHYEAQQAASKRAAEEIAELKAQYAAIVISKDAEREAQARDASASVLVARQTAEKRIAELRAEAAKFETEAAQRIAKAELAANEAEARVKKAEAALEALKRA